ncbi:uncharacterized protein LOC128385902 [Panonychus citri]|uniref:uncharacterized protein LOC128385902 n=1 Tax=Panonychus citri TaxID=50023 RepID=UPI0023075219|nr:uncharacterized protein LOC128385902 [Panonychus citri]
MCISSGDQFSSVYSVMARTRPQYERLIQTYESSLDYFTNRARPYVTRLRQFEFDLSDWYIPFIREDLEASLRIVRERIMPDFDDPAYEYAVELRRIDIFRTQLLHHLRVLQRNPLYIPDFIQGP